MWEKEKGCNPVHANMASHVHSLPGVPVWREIHTKEEEVKGRGS